jgi:hypothetical protein
VRKSLKRAAKAKAEADHDTYVAPVWGPTTDIIKKITKDNDCNSSFMTLIMFQNIVVLFPFH